MLRDSVAWQTLGSHGFAPPPSDGFALVVNLLHRIKTAGWVSLLCANHSDPNTSDLEVWARGGDTNARSNSDMSGHIQRGVANITPELASASGSGSGECVNERG